MRMHIGSNEDGEFDGMEPRGDGSIALATGYRPSVPERSSVPVLPPLGSASESGADAIVTARRRQRRTETIPATSVSSSTARHTPGQRAAR